MGDNETGRRDLNETGRGDLNGGDLNETGRGNLLRREGGS